MLIDVVKKTESSRLFSLAEQIRREFEGQVLPEPRKGVFKYLPLKSLYEKKLEVCRRKRYTNKYNGICFYNGFLQELKGVDPRIEVMSFDDALGAYQLELAHEFQKKRVSPFTKMALAYPQSGVFIYIPANTVINKPINFDFIVDQKGGYCNPIVRVFVARGSNVTFESRFVNEGSNGMQNCAVSIELAKDATLDWINCKNLASDITIMDAYCVKQAANSQFNYTSMTNGSENFLQNIQVELDGEGADCNIKGFYTLKKTDQAHVHVEVKHLQENCTSNQFFRGLLADESVASFRGNVFVDKKAQKTDAYQLCNHLMLGQRAKAIAEPNLEIFADDVKASHGATMKRLDSDDLFYLKSRGISRGLAQKILAQGFCMKAVDHLSNKLKQEALEFFDA